MVVIMGVFISISAARGNVVSSWAMFVLFVIGTVISPVIAIKAYGLTHIGFALAVFWSLAFAFSTRLLHKQMIKKRCLT
ncbi:MAG: hypothetical protein RL497_1864 [Pseudomonadota bacterium]